MRKSSSIKKPSNMEEYCEFIRNKLSLTIPVNIYLLLNKLTIKYVPTVIDKDLLYKDALYKDEVIYYDSSLSQEKLKFALCRELAKVLFPNYNDKIINEFAAEMLMPTSEFCSICLNNPNESSEVSLKELANYFGVTTHAVDIRGQVLHLW